MMTFVQGDRPLLKRTCLKNSDRSVIDLTGYTSAKLFYRIEGGALVEKTMTFLSPRTNGQVEYQFTAGEFLAGRFNGEIEIIDAAGRPFRQDPPIAATIRSKV